MRWISCKRNKAKYEERKEKIDCDYLKLFFGVIA